MEIQKAKIMDLYNDYAVVLTENAEFIRIRRKSAMSIGTGVIFTEQDIYVKQKHFVFPKRFFQIACIAMLLLVVISTQSFAPLSYAVISVDINPSVQIFIDSDYNVVKIESKNEDGTRLLTEYEFEQGKAASLVITEILNLASQMNYLKADKNEILIAASLTKAAAKSEDKVTKNNEVNALIESILSDVDYSSLKNENVVISSVVSNAVNVKAAEEEQMTIGTYERNHHSETIKPYMTFEAGKAKKNNSEPGKPETAPGNPNTEPGKPETNNNGKSQNNNSKGNNVENNSGTEMTQTTEIAETTENEKTTEMTENTKDNQKGQSDNSVNKNKKNEKGLKKIDSTTRNGNKDNYFTNRGKRK